MPHHEQVLYQKAGLKLRESNLDFSGNLSKMAISNLPYDEAWNIEPYLSFKGKIGNIEPYLSFKGKIGNIEPYLSFKQASS